jgi:hypothetical protein
LLVATTNAAARLRRPEGRRGGRMAIVGARIQRTARNILLAASFGNDRFEFPLRSAEPHV